MGTLVAVFLFLMNQVGWVENSGKRQRETERGEERTWMMLLSVSHHSSESAASLL